MDFYSRFIEEYIKEALQNTSGTNSAISEYLWSKGYAGRFASHRDERNKALIEARRVFDEYRHWPIEIILSHLGIEDKETLLSFKKKN